MPRVSVVIPNYNHARYLDQRIRSVLEQSLDDIEVIILDDASTDDSRQVLHHYRDHPKIRIVLDTKNSGSPCRQWNRGVSLCTAPLVWIAEADDVAESDFLEILISRLESNSKAVLAYCQSWIIDDEDRRVGDLAEWTDDIDPNLWRRDFTSDGKAECANHLIIKNTIPNASAVVFRRDAFVRSGCAHEGMRLCGDWLTWARLALEGEVIFVARPLNHFRRHSSSVRATTNAFQHVTESLQVSRSIMDQIPIPAFSKKLAAVAISNQWWVVLRHSAASPRKVSRIRIALNTLHLGWWLPFSFLTMIPAAWLARRSWIEPLLRLKRRLLS